MTASSILSAIAPQFDSNANRTTHLQLAEQRTSNCIFGTNRNLAVALRAAHSLTLSTRAQSTGGVAGSISSLREGDLAISYSNTNSGNANDLNTTSYGVELQGLIDGNVAAASVCGVIAPPCE